MPRPGTISKPVEEPESLSISPYCTISHVLEANAVDLSEKKFANCQPRMLASKEIFEKKRNIGPSNIINRKVFMHLHI